MAAWLSPTGFNDPDVDWTDEYLAYDENTASLARQTGGAAGDCYPIELLSAEDIISCSKVRIFAETNHWQGAYPTDPNLKIEVYYGGDYHEIWSGVITRRTWIEKAIGSTQTVSKAKITWNYLPPWREAWLFEFDFWGVRIPTVTTQAVSSVEATTATGNGNITNTGGENCSRRGFCYKVGTTGDPTTSDSTAYDDGDFGTGAYTKGLTGLSPGTSYRVRAYAINSAGTAYGTTVQILTKPAAPTNVQATDGIHSDKVVVTWAKSTGATGYQVYRDTIGLGWLGDVATFDDTLAARPSITPGDAVAGDGTFTNLVVLNISGEGTSNGTTHTYKVRAKNTTGESADSGTNTGYRAPGALSYQWQRSSGDADSGYSNIDGATAEEYYDMNAPAPTVTPGTASASDGTSTAHVTLSLAGESANVGAGRYYRCVLNADGCVEKITGTDRGYRGVGALTRQWYRSAGDSDASYSLLSGATTDPYNDTTAPAPTITPGAADASDGLYIPHVALSLSGQSASVGAGRYYKCLVAATGAESQYSTNNRGYRSVGGLTYQWQRSAADSDASYSNIDGATTASYDDTGAPANGDGRYYRCVENATGAGQQISTVDRGYRAQAHEKSLSDSVTLAESLTKGVGQVQADSLALADSPVKALTLEKADVVALAENIIKESEFKRTATDTILVSDTVADIVEFYLALSEGLALADVVIKSLGLTKADSVVLDDSFARLLEFYRTSSDTLTLADVIAKAVELGKADSVSITDALVKASEFYLARADNVAIADALDCLLALKRLLSDSVALADSVAKDISQAQNDIIGIADAISKSMSIPEADSLAIADSLSKALALVKTDTLALADLLTKAVGLSKADTLTLAESLATQVAFYRAPADTLIVSDSIADIVAFYLGLSDAVAMVDGLVKGTGLNKVESVALTDSIAKVVAVARTDTVVLAETLVKALGLSKADSLSVADTLTKAAVLVRTDSVALSDSLVKVAEFYRSLTDAQAISDSLAKTTGVSRSDTIALSDSSAIDFYRVLSDSVVLADSTSKAFGLTKADTVALADALAKAVGLPQADALQVADTLLKLMGLAKADTLLIADSMTTQAEFYRSLTETIAVSDSIADVVEFFLGLDDTVVLSDSLTKAVEFCRSMADTLTLADVIVKGVGATKVDTVALADALSRTLEFYRDVSDALSIADEASKFAGLTKADAISVSDSLATLVEFYRGTSDTVGITDSLAKALAIAKVDTVVLADIVAKAIAIERTDTMALADTLSKALGLSKADTLLFIDKIVWKVIAPILSLFEGWFGSHRDLSQGDFSHHLSLDEGEFRQHLDLSEGSFGSHLDLTKDGFEGGS